jgi:hypothetical protein
MFSLWVEEAAAVIPEAEVVVPVDSETFKPLI